MAQVPTPQPTVKSPSAAPVRKVAAGGLGGAVATILIWVLVQFAHVQIDPTIAAAITTIVTFLVGYIVPPSANDAPVRA